MLTRAIIVLACTVSLAGLAQPVQAASPACSGAALTEEAMLGCLTGMGPTISATSRGIRPATPGAAPEPAPVAAMDLEIGFAFGSSELSGDAKANLQHLAHVLNAPALAAKTIKVIGHTDGAGSDEDNQLLSVARAQAVGFFLAQQGVAANRLNPTGVGKRDYKNPQDPLAAENRRVEIVPAG